MSTYTPIATQTISSSTTSITFSGIPQFYTDLVLIFEGVASGSNAKTIKFNGDTSALYSCTTFYGTGSTAATGRYSDSYIDVVNSFANRQMTIIQIINYSNSTTNKIYISRHSSAATSTEAIVGLWRSNSAINSITINTSTTNTFSAGSNFTLYGIGAGSPKAFGGDTVVNDGTYWYHAFISSGLFEPLQNINCDILVVAGGGGGGGNFYGGGGGAGGLVYHSSQSLTSNTRSIVTVGAGGAGTSSSVTRGGSGNNSSFASLTAGVGGGGGGSGSTGLSGGSGGGGGGEGGGSASAGGSGTSGQGFAGGSGFATSGRGAGGGGGGASAVGGNGSFDTGGTGGNGTSTYSSWGSITKTGQNISNTFWYAGGGGGSTYESSSSPNSGGNGGGGAGSAGGAARAAVSGTRAAGGGGGGWSAGGVAGPSGSGGSGIVIVRYLV
jgi:hypothetical protein